MIGRYFKQNKGNNNKDKISTKHLTYIIIHREYFKVICINMVHQDQEVFLTFVRKLVGPKFEIQFKVQPCFPSILN